MKKHVQIYITSVFLCGGFCTTHAADYDQWKAGKFTTPELSDPSISGKLADPDKDGIVNLYEFAVNGEPKLANYTGLINGIYAETPMVSLNNDGYLQLSYRKATGVSGVLVIPQVSNDMLIWKSGTANLNQISVINISASQLDIITVNDRVLYSLENPRFIRVIVATDSDVDGLPDDWENATFGDLSEGAYGDYDDEGTTNVVEYQEGMNPLVPTILDTTGQYIALTILTPLE